MDLLPFPNITPIRQVIEALFQPDVRVATKYLSPSLIVRATRKTYRGKILKGKYNNAEVLLTIGRPNYQEREYIKLCKKAELKFPINKIHIKFMKKAKTPKRKASKSKSKKC